MFHEIILKLGDNVVVMGVKIYLSNVVRERKTR